MKILAKIPARSSSDLRAGTLRRCDLEAYGRLLDELAGARAIAITGREGRGETAVGLAAAAAAGDRRTVLIEADLSRPTLAATLGLAAGPGMSEYVQGEAEAGEILQPMALAGPGSGGTVEHLTCIVAGRPVAQPETLLSSERFRQAVDRLRGAYELVVLEGPSLEEGGSLLAVADLVDATLARCTRAEVPKPLRKRVDGLLTTAA